MTTDAWLAIAHHLAVFGVLAALVAEWALVRPGIDAAGVRRLGRIDAAYGALAGTVLAAGLARLWLGARPFEFYADNPSFWLKMAAFAAVALLSIRPTIRYLTWRRRPDGSGPPPPGEVRSAQRAISLQLTVFATIPVFAALMARGIGG